VNHHRRFAGKVCADRSPDIGAASARDDSRLLYEQLRLRDLSDESAVEQLRARFLGMMCDPKRDVAFFVGNQAKHVGTFSVLGVYYPER
jgi:hypothetical protein